MARVSGSRRWSGDKCCFSPRVIAGQDGDALRFSISGRTPSPPRRGVEQVGARGKESCRSGCLESMRNWKGNVDGKEEFQAFPPWLQLVTCQEPSTEEQTEDAFCNTAEEWQQDWQAPGPAGPYWQAPCVWGGPSSCRAFCGYSSWESQQPIIRISGLLSVSFLLPNLSICWLSVVLLWKWDSKTVSWLPLHRKPNSHAPLLPGRCPPALWIQLESQNQAYWQLAHRECLHLNRCMPVPRQEQSPGCLLLG